MIVIDDVSFKYKEADCLSIDHVSLHIKRGECVLLAGRSGCGKTTMLRLMNGLIPHYYEGEIDGNVTLSGKNVEAMKMYEIAKVVGTVYQNPRAQFFNVDTDSEILFGIENLAYEREELQRRFERTVEETGVNKLTGRNIFALSGGEKQKIAFASVYAMDPQVYLLDEPSANLDYQAIEELKQRIKQLKEAGKTVVISEHRLYYLKELADRVIYMEKGKIAGCYDRETFYTMTVAERKAKGLRALEKQVKIKCLPYSTGDKKQILQVKNIYAGYKKQVVLKDVSFEATQGDVVGITGYNGAGKSTLAETLCGLNKIVEGEIIYNGRKQTKKKRNAVGYMVFQDVDYQLFADSVINECVYGFDEQDVEKACRILEKLNLKQHKKSHPMTLSGGQKQRLAVAVSMMCEKDILIFDEPTSGLDYDSMIRVSQLIRNLSDEGKIVFLITHDYELINEVCNRLFLVKNGVLTENYGELIIENIFCGQKD